MKPSEHIKPVAKVARERERNAASKLGKTLSEAQQQKRQLEELISYREQYIKTYQVTARSGMSPVQLREYHLFIARLDSAIAEQQQRVTQCSDHCNQSRSQWQAMRNHIDMVEKLLENRRYLEQKHREEQEQKELDDRPVRGPRFPSS